MGSCRPPTQGDRGTVSREVVGQPPDAVGVDAGVAGDGLRSVHVQIDAASVCQSVEGPTVRQPVRRHHLGDAQRQHALPSRD